MEVIAALMNKIDSWIWGLPMLVLLCGTHIFMTFRTGFIQRKTFTGIRLSVTKDPDSPGDVSQFQALTTALASTIGTGNIIGVGTAIYLGGPGAVLWCWLTGVFGIATKYAESLIAVKYRVQTADGRMMGGAMYALERGLKWKKFGKVMAVLFALFAMLASFGIGCGTQINAIAEVLETNLPISLPRIAIGIVFGIITAIIIIGGIESIAVVCEKLVPLFERIARKVTLKEQVVDFPPQPVITKDNVTMQIDTVVYFQITDPKLFAYGIESPMAAIENLTATTLRNIIGDLELDQTLTSRDIINTKMRSILDEATDDWGIKVNRVELKNIIPPAAIQESMEKQMKAERERRESILVAEGKKQSAILVAEGEKEATVLAAEANRLAKIKEAEGEAEALLTVQKALADSINLLNEAAPTEQVIKLKSLEAFSSAADGKATKIIIPSEIQSLAGLATSFKEVMTDPKREQPEK